MRVLFMTNHRPKRSPGQRFRFEQYLPYLRAQGIECDVSFIIDERDDRLFYAPGHLRQKAGLALRSLGQRRSESTASALSRYDVVFVFREALFFGPPWIERRIARSAARMVLDFDDAIWIPAVSEANRWGGLLKFTGKTREVCRLADVVTVGNAYLGDFARAEGARRVELLPTTIDTDHHVPRPGASPDPARICIGWTGSFSTLVHFERAVGALRRIKTRFGDRVRFTVIGDARYRNESLGIQGLPWRLESEVEDLHAFDIGIMPLPDDAWTRGKCACKALQYMALGIPAVVSPVGVNRDIVADGDNGFLVDTEDEWVECLSRLVRDEELRRRVGAAGRRTVEEGFSVRSQQGRYLEILGSLATP